MQTLTFQCGHCNKLMAVGIEYLGQQVRCPHCQQVVIAPSHPAPTSPPPEAAKDGPLEAHGPSDSPFEVAPDAARNAAALPSKGHVFGNDPDPRLELAPSWMQPIAAPTPASPPFAAFESAVEESTPAAAGVAAPSSPTRSEGPPLDNPLSAPDVSSPWTSETPGASNSEATHDLPTATVRAPRSSQFGMALFIGLVFLPLLLYSVLVTILAVMFWMQIPRDQSTQPNSPRPAKTSSPASR